MRSLAESSKLPPRNKCASWSTEDTPPLWGSLNQMKTWKWKTTTSQDDDEDEDKEDNRKLETARFEVFAQVFYLSVNKRSSKKESSFTAHSKKESVIRLFSAPLRARLTRINFALYHCLICETETPRPNSYTGG